MLGRLLLDLLKRGPANAVRPESRTATEPEAGVLPLDAANCLVRGRHGWFLANRCDSYLGQALIRYGEYAEIEHDFLSGLIAPGDNVIEVGANIGGHAVGLAKAIGPSGTLIAIEAQPAIHHILCANLALNALRNVVIHSCGCGERRQTMTVPVIDYAADKPHNSGGMSLRSDGEGIPVPVMPLDELTENLASLRLIKIDVEGMELDVLRGGRRLIARCRPLLYVENDRLEKSKALIEHLMGEGYRLWWHIPPLYNPANFFGVGEDIYPTIHSINMFCMPKEACDLLPPGVASLVEIADADHHPCAQPTGAGGRG